MKILVTGGAGYIGSHTCLELLQAGHEVVVVDNLSNSKEESLKRIQEISGKSLEFHRVDLLDREALDRVFAGADIDAVIHFAGLKAVGESVKIPLSYYHNNITGTLILCELMGEVRGKEPGIQLFRYRLRRSGDGPDHGRLPAWLHQPLRPDQVDDRRNSPGLAGL